MSKHTNSERLLKYLKEQFKYTDIKVEPPHVLRASRLGNYCTHCEILKGIHGINKTYRDRDPFGGPLLSEIGTYLHLFVQNDLLGPIGVLKGHWVCVDCYKVYKDCYYPSSCACGNTVFHYEEYTIKDKELGIQGHVDGVVNMGKLNALLNGEDLSAVGEENRVLLEVKSTNMQGFSNVMKTLELPEYYRMQASFYQNECLKQGLIDRSETVFLYFDRNFANQGAFSYHKEDEMLTKIDKKVRNIREGIRQKRLLGTPNCIVPTSKDAKNCLFKDVCFGYEKDEEKIREAGKVLNDL